MNKYDCMVSIICLTYNHERFIADALESLVTQKTNYKFEIIVHEDASTDNTKAIIQQYENKYPNVIKPIYQRENQYSQRISITKTYIVPNIKGKYVAWCEGDDYWTDTRKIERQVSILEEYPECVAVFSRVAVVDVNGKDKSRTIPSASDYQNNVILNSNQFLSYTFYPGEKTTMAWQISGLLMRSDLFIDYITNPPIYRKAFDVGDQPLFFYLGIKGSVYFINDIMSCYRRQGNNYSWSARIKKEKHSQAEHFVTESQGFEEVDEYTEKKHHPYAQKGIDYRLFLAYKATNNLKGMKSKQLRYIYKSYSLKYRLLIYCRYFIQFLLRYKNKLIKD